MSPQSPTRVSAHLPLSATDLQVLLALSHEELYGYALLQRIEQDSKGILRPDIGSLYRTLHRLSDVRLIALSDRRQVAAGPGKPRRYYRITALGARVLAAELDRLERLIRRARRDDSLSGSTATQSPLP